MGGPHRSHGYTVLCRAETAGTLCRSPADGACLRCGVPLCHEHYPGADKRCAACETEFATTAPTRRSLIKTESRLVTAAGLTAGVVIAVFSGLNLPWTIGVIATSVAAGHWFRGMAHLADPDRAGLCAWLLRGRRSRFLRERALPAGRTQNRLA